MLDTKEKNKKIKIYWRKNCQKLQEQAPEVRIQIQVKSIETSHLTEWTSARHFTYLRPPF